ncbi:MAG TPA: flagellar hook-length control protein FliK [Rhodocyclaceae bacterium]|nr:flagellar hook-length control protein FliK [Rhodocyclaceae bacterium]
MGITAVSPANLGAPAKGAASQLSADSAGGADFAALLTQQLSGPTLLEMALQPAIGTGKELDAKDGTAKLLEDDGAAEDNPNALLGLAGLFPGIADIPKNIRPADAAGSAKAGQDAGKEPLGGIIGELNSRAANDDQKSAAIGADAKQNPIAALANEGLGKETAIIAGDSQPGSGNGQNFAATLAAHNAQAHQPQAASEGNAAIRTPIADSRWGQDFGEKIVWLAKNDQQVAQLSINPPQLGPMHISLSLNGDQASAVFASPHAEVRQAIQDAMPQLREMLAGAGINLGQANVGTQLPQQQQNSGTQPQFSAPSQSEGDNAILRADTGQGTSASLTAVRGGRGMVDLFA